MPAIARSPVTSDPRRVIQEAISWARQQGYRVVPSAMPGVVCASTVKPEWRVDPAADGLSPLGCAILKHQPQVSILDIAEWLSVGTSQQWVIGYTVGLCGLQPITGWQTTPHRQLVQEAYQDGVEMRVLLLTAVCERHPGTRYQIEKACPRCQVEDAPAVPPQPSLGRGETLGDKEETTAVSCKCCAAGGLVEHPGICSETCPRHEECPGVELAKRKS